MRNQRKLFKIKFRWSSDSANSIHIIAESIKEVVEYLEKDPDYKRRLVTKISLVDWAEVLSDGSPASERRIKT